MNSNLELSWRESLLIRGNCCPICSWGSEKHTLWYLNYLDPKDSISYWRIMAIWKVKRDKNCIKCHGAQPEIVYGQVNVLYFCDCQINKCNGLSAPPAYELHPYTGWSLLVCEKCWINLPLTERLRWGRISYNKWGYKRYDWNSWKLQKVAIISELYNELRQDDPSSLEVCFLRALCEDPDDIVSMCAYQDWLEEQGRKRVKV